MCGIAGALLWNDRDDGRTSSAIVSAMTDALSHRGPDGHGVVSCEPRDADGRGLSVTFGHRRLAILDLSERAAQPMRDAAGRSWITYNGEIYNFRALRRELEGQGRHFRTTSDTEVILQGYDAWGEHVVDRLQGMFAFAIWDSVRQRLLLARDRIGIKPLYIYRTPSMLLFASEIRALLASGVVPRKLDRDALPAYLAYQTVPTPRTLVRDVRMAEPGSLTLVGPRATEYSERRYWDLLDDASDEARQSDDNAARSRVGALLDESAALHLVSDVPVGIFLSGGIDSSALVSLTHRAGVVPRTFSVVLPGSAHDEAPFARQIARLFGAEHTEIALTERDFFDQLPGALASVDHPSGDGLNTFVVSQAVRASGIKVALSGLGGDELFGGYPSFGRMRRLVRYGAAWRRSSAPVRAAAASAVRMFGRDSVESTKAAAVIEGDGSIATAFPILRQIFSRRQSAALLGQSQARPERDHDAYVALIEAAVSKHPDAGLMSVVSYAEARTYMHDVLLRDTDQMSMAHGLEVRVPLLDHRLAEYVMGLPDRVKESNGVPKRLLVQSLGDALPADCVQRPKQGFVLPFDVWMKGNLREFCEHHLGTEGLAGRGVFREPALQSLWRSFLSGDRKTTWSRPWTLVALSAWIERHGLELS